MHLKYAIWVIFVILISGEITHLPVYAISLTEISKLAIANSIELQKQAKKLDVQKCELTIAMSELYPRLDTQYSFNYTDYSVTGRDPLARINVLSNDVLVYPFQPSKYKSSIDATLTQTLYAGGRINANIALSKTRLDEQTIAYQLLQNALLGDIAEAYWSWVLALQDEDFQKYKMTRLKAKEKIASMQKLSGLTSKKADLISAINIANTQEDLMASQKIVALKKTELEFRLNTEISTINISQNTLRTLPTLKKLWAQLKLQSYDNLKFKQQTLIMAGRVHQQSVENSRFLPEVLLQSGINYFSLDNNNPEKTLENLKYGSLYAALTVRWNAFNGFRDMALSQKAVAETKVAELDIQHENQVYAVTLKQKEHYIEQAILDATRTQKNVELATVSFQDQINLYNLQKLSEDQLLDAEELLKKSELNHQHALIQLEVAIIKWCKESNAIQEYVKEVI